MGQPINTGKPVHKMQPQTGGIPPIQVQFLDDGHVLLSIFCRSGPTKGKWHTRSASPSATLKMLDHFYWLAQKPEELLKELEDYFQWEWDGTTEPTINTKGLSLADLGL